MTPHQSVNPLFFWFKGGVLKMKPLLLTCICTSVHLIFSRHAAGPSEERQAA